MIETDDPVDLYNDKEFKICCDYSVLKGYRGGFLHVSKKGQFVVTEVDTSESFFCKKFYQEILEYDRRGLCRVKFREIFVEPSDFSRSFNECVYEYECEKGKKYFCLLDKFCRLLVI